RKEHRRLASCGGEDSAPARSVQADPASRASASGVTGCAPGIQGQARRPLALTTAPRWGVCSKDRPSRGPRPGLRAGERLTRMRRPPCPRRPRDPPPAPPPSSPMLPRPMHEYDLEEIKREIVESRSL